MTIASRGAGERMKQLAAEELLEDDDADTGVLRIRYEESMDALAAKRIEIAQIKRNIPPPERP